MYNQNGPSMLITRHMQDLLASSSLPCLESTALRRIVRYLEDTLAYYDAAVFAEGL